MTLSCTGVGCAGVGCAAGGSSAMAIPAAMAKPRLNIHLDFFTFDLRFDPHNVLASLQPVSHQNERRPKERVSVRRGGVYGEVALPFRRGDARGLAGETPLGATRELHACLPQEQRQLRLTQRV